MREILFRGENRKKGQYLINYKGDKCESNWVYGGVLQGASDFSIIYGAMDMDDEESTEKFIVYTDTLGQYTGLIDINGTRIFEGDVVKELSNFNSIGVIEYDDTNARFIKKEKYYNENRPLYEHLDYEVIGNIHDNPELLKERDIE